ncbi:ABC transporter substrate-binding protein [Caproicibacter fermentans]|uniref:ABC transporter substrate-binding protein n=1 Tax=Caproicibacter fermentans TaxID=2576756 RepID=A0A7G8TFQ0_9FIRM|nr:ABC transporter substrate-binding protein [Caproicibacter fermentans]QNK42441.1 ABC transporter substrate-binding protein [Caproicibacter fermentans]
MKKRVSRIVSAALAIALTAGMTACSTGTGSESGTGSAASAKANVNAASGTTQIKFWHYMADNEGSQLQKIVDTYNNSQSKVKVAAQYVPRTELMKQYTIGAVSGDLPDVGIVDNPDNASYVSMGVCEDITDLFNAWGEAKFLDGPLASCKSDSKIYGLPLTSNCLGLFYDTDVLQKAGVNVPTTWSELTAACKKLTQGKQKGLAFSAVATEEGTFQFMPFLLSAGGGIDDLASANSVKSLDYFSGLVKSGYVSKECINWTQADVEKQFSAGSAAMMINGPWNIAAVKKDAANKHWKVAKIPKADDGNYTSILGGENVIVCKGAKKDAAWDFLKYIDNKENSQKLCANAGYLSPRSDVKGEEMFKDNAVMALFVDLMPTAKSRGPHVKWPEVSSAIQTAMQESITGKATAQQAMGEAKAKVDKINASLKK